MSAYIYVLIDPRTNECRYVGKTVNPQKRLGQHLSERRASYRKNWVQSLLNQNVVPEMIIIDQAPRSEIDDLECFWISYLKYIGASLVNRTKGGDGGEMTQEARTNHKKKMSSPEMREFFSNHHKRVWARPGYKDRMSESISTAKMNNLEGRKKHSEYMKNRFRDEDYRGKILAGLSKTRVDPDWRKKIGEYSKATWSQPGRKEEASLRMKELFENNVEYRNKVLATLKRNRTDPDVVKKKSDANKKAWSNPEYKASMCAIRKEQNNRAEVRNKHRDNTKALWENPVYREKTLNARKASWADPETKRKRLLAMSEGKKRKKLTKGS